MFHTAPLSILHDSPIRQQQSFKCKLKEQKPRLQFFLHKISEAENVEKTITIQNGKKANHEKKWKSLSMLHLSKTLT